MTIEEVCRECKNTNGEHLPGCSHFDWRAAVAQAKADGANEERSLHWIRENSELTAIRQQVAELAVQLATVTNERDAARAEAKLWRYTHVAELQEESEQLHRVLKQIRNERDAACAEIAELRSKYDFVSALNEHIVGDVDPLRAELTTARAEAAQLRAELEAWHRLSTQ